MSELRIEGQARGTRILMGLSASIMLGAAKCLSILAECGGYVPVILPAIDDAERWVGKAGERMGVTGPSQPLVLCPERTDQCRRIAQELTRRREMPDGGLKLWYAERCYRLERPQAGRYREFTQFGCEWLGAPAGAGTEMRDLALEMVKFYCPDAVLNTDVTRGLSYYTGGGFEIDCPRLGAQRQVCGGGRYPEGYGFAIGVERLVLGAGL